jgi:alkylated DNA nucleotide flippase Atl1
MYGMLFAKFLPGAQTTYAQIAQKVGKPKAVRAVGTAIGANPVAWFIPVTVYCAAMELWVDSVGGWS